MVPQRGTKAQNRLLKLFCAFVFLLFVPFVAYLPWKFFRTNFTMSAISACAAGEAAGREVFVLVGVAVSVQAEATRKIAIHVRASTISFIRQFLRVELFLQGAKV